MASICWGPRLLLQCLVFTANGIGSSFSKNVSWSIHVSMDCEVYSMLRYKGICFDEQTFPRMRACCGIFVWGKFYHYYYFEWQTTIWVQEIAHAKWNRSWKMRVVLYCFSHQLIKWLIYLCFIFSHGVWFPVYFGYPMFWLHYWIWMLQCMM